MFRKIIKWLVFRLLYPCWYRLVSLKPIDPHKVIFVENHEDHLTDNFILIYEELEKRGYDLRVHYLKVSSSGWGEIIRKSCRLLWDMGDAKCVFLNESNSLFGAIPLRSETKLIQLWHACGAFKKWGHSVADKTFGDDKRELERYPAHRNYTLVPVSGHAVCWAYDEAFGFRPNSGIVRPLGVSRTDVFFDEKARIAASSGLEEQGILPGGRKIILYAPTFRGDIKNAKAPDALDLDVFYRELREDYIVLVKQHPFVKERTLIPKEYADFCYDVTSLFPMETLLMAADICITDYSSVVFEYSLMQRPILFFAYDLTEYYDERGFYYPYENFVPGPIALTTEELVECIKKKESYDFNNLEIFRKQYMSGCDGHSTEKIINAVFESRT